LLNWEVHQHVLLFEVLWTYSWECHSLPSKFFSYFLMCILL
jgi:hypothetical protein